MGGPCLLIMERKIQLFLDYLDSKKSDAAILESEPFTITRQGSEVYINGTLIEKVDERALNEVKKRISGSDESDEQDCSDPDKNDAIPID